MLRRVKVDTALVETVQQMGGFKTKKAAATAALREYVRHLKGARLRGKRRAQKS